MLGLMFLTAFAVYLLVSIFVVLFVVRWAKARGRSPQRWGWAAALTMYLLVFWDWIPTFVAFRYYCANEAGFWVYKSPEQWKVEKSGGITTPRTIKASPRHASETAYEVYPLNERVSLHHVATRAFLTVGRHEQSLLDIKTNDILAKKVYFQSGRCSGAPKRLLDFKFWINHCECATSSTPFMTGDGMSWGLILEQFETTGE